jgi:hypothetical protein
MKNPVANEYLHSPEPVRYDCQYESVRVLESSQQVRIRTTNDEILYKPSAVCLADAQVGHLGQVTNHGVSRNG